jgi:hypothetical protein
MEKRGTGIQFKPNMEFKSEDIMMPIMTLDKNKMIHPVYKLNEYKISD